MKISFDRLKRAYLYYEAMSLYDAYYQDIRNSLVTDKNIPEDVRPLTWVPLLFHCTSVAALRGIIASETINTSNGYVSLTECRIDQLDRFRYRGKADVDVAIAFPRSVLESKGLFQPAYIHNSKNGFRGFFHERMKMDLPEEFSEKKLREALTPYIILDDDLGAMNELRVPRDVSINDAVWILCKDRDTETKDITNEVVLEFCRKLGVTRSYWHRSHQEGIINENTYIKITGKGKWSDIECKGEFYFKKGNQSTAEASVNFPHGNAFRLKFFRYPHSNRNGWRGPYTKFEMAEFFYKKIKTCYPKKYLELPNRIRFDD